MKEKIKKLKRIVLEKEKLRLEEEELREEIYNELPSDSYSDEFFTLTKRESASVKIFDKDKIDKKYETTIVDKWKIMADLKEGKTVAGAELRKEGYLSVRRKEI